MALYNYKGPLAPGLNFVKNSLTYFYSLFISSSALHLIAERLASVTADTSFKVFGLTRLRIEPSLPASNSVRLSMLVTRELCVQLKARHSKLQATSSNYRVRYGMST